jgi:PIN domain nuclease of toxin-antitoxin system
MASAAVDASALLAYLFGEAGGERFEEAVGSTPAISALNWSEVVQKTISRRRIDVPRLRTAADAAGLTIVDLTPSRAEHVARLWSVTRGVGLSIADRACLALAIELGAPTVTTDRAWASLDIEGLQVACLR